MRNIRSDHVLCSGWFDFLQTEATSSRDEAADSLLHSISDTQCFILVSLLKAVFFPHNKKKEKRKTPWMSVLAENASFKQRLKCCVITSQRGNAASRQPLYETCSLLDVVPIRLCRKDTDKGFFVCSRRQIIWPYRTGVNREREKERGGREGED